MSETHLFCKRTGFWSSCDVVFFLQAGKIARVQISRQSGKLILETSSGRIATTTLVRDENLYKELESKGVEVMAHQFKKEETRQCNAMQGNGTFAGHLLLRLETMPGLWLFAPPAAVMPAVNFPSRLCIGFPVLLHHFLSQVTVVAMDPPTLLSLLNVFAGPILTIIGLVVLVRSGSNNVGTGQGLFNIGQSKARWFDRRVG